MSNLARRSGKQISRNAARDASESKGYGFRPLEADAGEGVMKAYTLDHRFELVLAKRLAKGDDDEVETDLGTLYDKADEIFKDIVYDKIGLPALVINIFAPSIGQPEVFAKQKLVAIRMQFTIKYRSNL